MHRVGADQTLVGEGQVDWYERARSVLPAAEAAVAADQALEGRHFVGARVQTAVHVDVRRLGPVGHALDELRCVRTERQQGVDALHMAVVEPVPTLAAQHDGAVVVHHDHEAHTWVRGQPGHEAGVARRQVSSGELPLLAAYVDQAEVPGSEDVEGLVPLGGLRLGLRVPGRGRRRDRVGVVAITLVHGVRGRLHRAAADAAGRGELPHQRPGTTPALDVGVGGRDVALGETSDERCEVLPVAVEERRALRLPVVGEDHEPVLPRRGTGHHLQLVEDTIHGLESLQALRTQYSRVVGDLVVVHVVDVDRPEPLEHVLRDQDGVEVAQRTVGDAAQQGGLPVPLTAGLDVAADRSPGLEPVTGELGDGPRDRPGESRRRHDELRDGLSGLLTAARAAAHGEHGRRRVTGEQVADAHPAVDQQSLAGGHGCFDDRGVGGLVGHQDPVCGAVVPPERRDAVDDAVQDSHLAGRRRGGQLGRPLVEAVGAGSHPPGHRRHGAGGDRHLQHWERHPVELDEHDALDVGIGQRRRPPPS